MAGTAGFTLVHVAHLGFESSCLERECFSVAVSTFVHAEVEFVAEVCIACFCLEKHIAGFVTFMALVALTGYGKCILAVMAGAAGFTSFHTCHGSLEGTGLVWEDFCVAVWAFEHADVYLVAEYRISYAFKFEGDFAWAHPFVAVTTVAGNSEGFLAVMAGTTGSAFFHLCH